MESENNEQKKLRTLDFYMGLVFTGLGCYMCLASLGMFRDPTLSAVPLPANPGMTTVTIGALLALMGGIITIVGLRGAGNPLQSAVAGLKEMSKSRSFRKTLIVLGMIAVYFFVFWRHTPYWFSTMLFLAAMMRYFKAGAWWKILTISTITTLLISYFFGHLALVLLPADPGWLAPLYRTPMLGQGLKGIDWFFTKLIPALMGLVF